MFLNLYYKSQFAIIFGYKIPQEGKEKRLIEAWACLVPTLVKNQALFLFFIIRVSGAVVVVEEEEEEEQERRESSRSRRRS